MKFHSYTFTPPSSTTNPDRPGRKEMLKKWAVRVVTSFAIVGMVVFIVFGVVDHSHVHPSGPFLAPPPDNGSFLNDAISNYSNSSTTSVTRLMTDLVSGGLINFIDNISMVNFDDFNGTLV